MNLCRGCGQDFAAVSGFDKHRVGSHAFDYSPDRPDGRRCLTVAEIEARGMRCDTNGRWRLPTRGRVPWME